MFHFKKFSIDDSKAAMKIGTDAVLLGAWIPCENGTRILDIGTGCGIVAIMMAQRNRKVPVDAVEIDADAAILAEQNFKLSPWADQLSLFHAPIQDFALKTHQKYSLVISNPPFFTNSLKTPHRARNIARHNDTLSVKDLLGITSKLLTEKGKAAFILPADAYENWVSEASSLLLYPALLTRVKSSASHKPHRVMILFSKVKISKIIENEIFIYRSKNIHSNEYRELTREFYLNF
jgi:tRNA1Val (adenine37-N6)-methyltransferase